MKVCGSMRPTPFRGPTEKVSCAPQEAGALALELAVGFLLGLGLLQRGELAFGEPQAFLRDLRRERLETLLHGLAIVPLPHAANPGRRDRGAALADLVGDRIWPKAGCSSDSSTMITSISGGVRLASRGLRRVRSWSANAPPVSESSWNREKLSREEPILLQAWLTLPSCLASSSTPTLARMIFWSLVMVGVLSNAEAGRCAPRPLRARPRLMPQPNDTACQIKSKLLHGSRSRPGSTGRHSGLKYHGSGRNYHAH